MMIRKWLKTKISKKASSWLIFILVCSYIKIDISKHKIILYSIGLNIVYLAEFCLHSGYIRTIGDMCQSFGARQSICLSTVRTEKSYETIGVRIQKLGGI